MAKAELHVLYEDNHLLALNKPPGLPTMGVAAGDVSLVTLAKQYIKRRYRKPGNVYVGVVSRLDTGTSAQIVQWELAGFILYLGLGPTALAYVLFCSGMARCRSANVGLIASMVEPAFAALLAWLLLNERLSATEVFGCALVMLAMLILCKSERMRWE
jgi:uncharacterized membrane protein